MPGEAQAGETAAQLASNRETLVDNVATIEDTLTEVGADVSVVAKEVGTLEASAFELLAAKGTGSHNIVEGSFRNPDIVKEELFDTDEPELVTSRDDALEAPTKYGSKTALSQEAWAVLEPMVIDAPDASVVIDAQITGVCHSVSKGEAWERWNMAKAAGKPPLPPPRYPPLSRPIFLTYTRSQAGGRGLSTLGGCVYAMKGRKEQ